MKQLLLITSFILSFYVTSSRVQINNGSETNNAKGIVGINRSTVGNYISHVLTESRLRITTDNGLLDLTFYSPDILKVQYSPSGSVIQDTTFTVVKTPGNILVEFTDGSGYQTFSSGTLGVFIKKYPVKISFISNHDTLLQEAGGFYTQAEGGGASFKIKPDESYYGTGSRAIPVDRKGYNLWSYNEAHYGYGYNTPTLNINIPLVMSNKGYGLFIDNQYPMYLDLGSSNQNEFNFSADGGPLRYYFIHGGNFAEILDNYTSLTGKQPLPPLWTMGFIQSKFGYENETAARNTVSALKSHGFPLDALVLDLYWYGGTSAMGNLDWDHTNWPAPVQMMADFKMSGVKTILITEPYFNLGSTNYPWLNNHNLFATNPDGAPHVFRGFWAGDASLIDLADTNATAWMWPFYRNRYNEGAGGWWCDLGEPESHPWEIMHRFGPAGSVHNIYSLLWAKMIWENHIREFGDDRLFNLIRSGFAGMQRYSAFPWSGDVQRTFDGLKAQIPIMLGAGMSGVGYMHSDVGGFTGESLNGELFARWVQIGAFAPVLRVHGTGPVEPIYYPEPYKTIAREYIKLRYRMLPYNYTLAWENTTKGIPLARQLNFYEPANTLLSNISDEYLWGENLLVAPVLEPGQMQRQVIFPAGRWIGFFNHQEYDGNNGYSVSCPVNDLLLFAKAGSFIPFTSQVYTTVDYHSDSLNIVYFPDHTISQSGYTLYADNGKSPASLSDQTFELISFGGTVSDHEIDIRLSKSQTTYPESPPSREISFEVRRVSQIPGKIEINASGIPAVNSLAEFKTVSPAWYFNGTDDLLYIHLRWDGSDSHITVYGLEYGVEERAGGKQEYFYLHFPSPNPCKDFSVITFDITVQADYKLRVYSLSGKLMKEVSFDNCTPGRHVFNLNTESLETGLYFLKFSGNGPEETKKLAVIR